jgi:CRISPR/Cas system-associated exonuclease Cas4 (RecB family)
MYDTAALVASLLADKGKRSRQKEIGPSEIGGCRRRLWYRLKEQEVTNADTLSLAAFMGTAIHEKIEQRIERLDPFGERLLREIEVESDGVYAHLKGHVDLFIPAEKIVIDWKTTTKKNLSKFPSEQQRWQVHLYAAMLIESGREVEEVALVAIARDGNENDVKIHQEPYDHSVTVAAMNWLEEIMSYQDDLPPADNHPRFCRDYCQFYDRTSEVGCPGSTAN